MTMHFVGSHRFSFTFFELFFCFLLQDDAGAALFCSTRRWGHMLVGIFQHLVATKLAEKQETAVGETTIVDSCSRGVEMRFSKTADQMKIFETIQKFDLASFVSIYDTCFREVPYNLVPGA